MTRVTMSRSFIMRSHTIASLALALLLTSPLFADGEKEDSQDQAAVAANDYGIAQVGVINKEVRQVWSEYQLAPSAPATDGEWCRRVFLDILGRIPTIEELQEFLDMTDSDKKAKLVGKLLYDEYYVEEYARNWTTLWNNILIGRNGGSERNSLTSRSGMQKFLRDSFARNKPYDRMVYQLVTATGVTIPGKENFNGATNFLAMKLDEKAGQATALTSKIFLGLQVQCTQCHNHPFNEWKQQKYWEMNAFFRQTRALKRYIPGTRDVSYAELINEDFAGEGTVATPEEAEIYYEQRNGDAIVAYPVFLDGTKASSPSGFVEDVVRRTELGKFIVQSEYLEKSIVNRMWSHFLGYGFTKPIDDMGPHNSSSHPALLDHLSSELRKSSFDLKGLIRWIVLSEAYSLSSRTNASNMGDDPLLGESPKFSHFYLRQMRAEELYESLLTATQASSRGSYADQERTKAQWLQQFVVAFGTDEGDETTTFNGTIPQALMMFNGDLIKEATKADKGSFVWKIANNNMKKAEKVNHLFMAGLGRKPTTKEVSIANKLLTARKGDTAAAMQDIWWVVLNSNEFIFNH